MTSIETDVVIAGAGIAGIAAAHALATGHGLRVTLVDDHAPLSLTSDKSTEAYRNWWPGPDDAMVRLMNRSIDLLEGWADASGNRILLNRRGYLYTTARPERAEAFMAEAAQAEAQGAGPLRVYRTPAETRAYRPSAHAGYRDHPDGADLFLGRDTVQAVFPWLAPELCAALHARRCGWFSGQQLGMFLLEEARAAGAVLLPARVHGVECDGGGVSRVHAQDAQGASLEIATSAFVNCAGPHARAVGALAGADLPLFSEAHYKISLEDTQGAVHRDAGLVILDDPQSLPWSDEERAELRADDATRWLTEPLPAGIHLRPEGYGASRTVLMLWDYHGERYDAPLFPLPEDPYYPEVVLRGMTTLVPGLSAYLDRLPRVYVDGGYYTKTVENRPLVGPSGARGAFVLAGLSGFGLMAAPAAAELLAAELLAAELLAAQVTGRGRPSYEGAFLPSRYDDPAYMARLASWGGTGQL